MKTIINEDEETLLLQKSKGMDVTRVIYDVLVGGIRGEIKKDSLLSTLTELTVSH